MKPKVSSLLIAFSLATLFAKTCLAFDHWYPHPWIVYGGPLTNPPVITSVTPSAGVVGDTIQVFGRNFDQLKQDPLVAIRFGVAWDTATNAQFEVNNDTFLLAAVPPGAISGKIYIARLEWGRTWYGTWMRNWRVLAASPSSFTVVSAPIAPTGLTAETRGFSSVMLSWNYAASGHTGFEIRHRRVSTGGGFVRLGTVAANKRSEPITELAADEDNEFQVRTVAGGVVSGPSNTASAHTGQLPAINITNGSSPTPFDNGGLVQGLVSARAYYDTNGDGILNAAPFFNPTNVDFASFPRWVPPSGSLGGSGVGEGSPQVGNRFLRPGNALIIIEFRERSNSPVQFLCAHLALNLTTGQITAAVPIAGDLVLNDPSRLVLFAHPASPPQWSGQVTPVNPGVAFGRLQGSIRAPLFFEDLFGIISSSLVEFDFDLMLRPENEFVPLTY